MGKAHAPESPSQAEKAGISVFHQEIPILPRIMTEYGHAVTGIDIHPGAHIGERFFIDHGTGVVIGETCLIGDDVKIYQGVTLGALSLPRDESGELVRGTKRHPTVEDNVTIGSGAKLLGPITVGHGAKVGANTVVIGDVPSNSTVVGNPGHTVRVEGRKVEGPDSDWIHLPDPVADSVRKLSERLGAVEARLEALDGERSSARVQELRPRRGPSTAGG